MIRARIRRSFPAGPESTPFTLDIEFEAAAGVTVLFGPSGSGKTLTLDSIAGFVRPDQGRILLDDDTLFDDAARIDLPPRKRRCGYVFQNYALFPHMTLRQNLEFAASAWRGLERHHRVNEMLDRFRLAEVSGRLPRELSGGQKQRCSIARALIGTPRLLLLDEPARGLDAPLKAELYTVLRQVRADFGTPILLVTHDLDECFELGEEMMVVDRGKIVQSGAPRQVLERPVNIDVARLLGRFGIFQAEILELNPATNRSLLRAGELQISGPYFPGHLRGDRVTLLIRPERLKAVPRPAGVNGLDLLGFVERPASVRLEFRGGLFVEMPKGEFEKNKHNKDWTVEFPPESMAIL